jgi:hypothetical protein
VPSGQKIKSKKPKMLKPNSRKKMYKVETETAPKNRKTTRTQREVKN